MNPITSTCMLWYIHTCTCICTCTCRKQPLIRITLKTRKMNHALKYCNSVGTQKSYQLLANTFLEELP